MMMDVKAAPLGLDDPRVPEHAQIVRNGPGGNAQQIRQRSDAQGAPEEKLYDIQAAFYGKRREYPRPLPLFRG